MGDVMLFNTQYQTVSKVVERSTDAGDFGYYPNTNQSALVAPEEVVMLCGQNGNNQLALVSWKKGSDRLELVHSF